MSYRHTKQHDGGPWWGVPRWRTREAPKAPSETPWCTRKAIPTRQGRNEFGKIRCPKCGRLLQIMTVDIENGYGDFWGYIPPHKRKSLETVKQKAHERRRRKKERRSSRGK